MCRLFLPRLLVSFLIRKSTSAAVLLLLLLFLSGSPSSRTAAWSFSVVPPSPRTTQHVHTTISYWKRRTTNHQKGHDCWNRRWWSPIYSSSSSNNPYSSALGATTTTTIDVNPETAVRNPQSFWEWAEYYGIVLENVQLNTQSNNWGLLAAYDAPAGSRVLFVPSSLRLSSDSIREQDFTPTQQQSIAQYIDATYNDGDTDIPLSCHFYLFLKVLQEYERGLTDSPYGAWWDAMPRKFSTSTTFSAFEMDCLPPFVKFLAHKDQYNCDLFQIVLNAIDTSTTISDATKNNEEVFKWAFNVVFSRARASPYTGEAEIIPVSDMINHNANPNVEVQWDQEGNVHVVLLRDVQAGEQLYKCYGQPTNPSRFLATYGFFDASPPATYCKLYPGLEASEELRNLGFGYDRMVFYTDTGAIAEEVWDVMLYGCLSGDPVTQQQFYQAHMTGDTETKSQLHQYYMSDTCSALLKHVDETLEELEKCEKTMDAGGMGLVHKNLPMIRRHNDFVRQLFTKVKRNLESILNNA